MTNFEVDTDKKWTPFSMSKNANKTILKKFTDHRSFRFNVTLPCTLTNDKKKPIINFKNPEGWENYKKVSDAHAESIREVIDNSTDTNELRIKINIIKMEIQVKSFGITWEGPSKQKKLVKRDSKELKEIYLKQQEELDELIAEGASTKDVNNKVYRLRDLLNGPKIKPSEPTCINDPVPGELITEREDIKQKSLCQSSV